VPVAPGTFGSLLAVPLYLALPGLPEGGLPALGVLAVAVALSWWVAGRADRLLTAHDDGSIVIDEVAGMLVALAGHGHAWGTIALVFVLFRVLDVMKPWPAGWIDRRLGGGAGVVLDDVASGVYANLLAHLLPW
jgi:phosphatidylglycerophosphatase A